jgi:acyl-CoA dehydrogenase
MSEGPSSDRTELLTLLLSGNGVSSDEESLVHRAGQVALLAKKYASAVDDEARFPSEAFAAIKAKRLLGALVPNDLGGECGTISDAVNICYVLARVCASTAMIFAMHQTVVAILVRHGQQSVWHRELLRRLCAKQLLFASSTTEAEGGGDLRSSICAVAEHDTGIMVTKRATVVSYGLEADGIITTARRSTDAPDSDQVLVAFLREAYDLELTENWNSLGMRGTCSAGFLFRARGEFTQVLAEPYRRIHAQTMMPVAHLVWSGVWAGIAAGAIERARQFVLRAAISGKSPPAASRLVRATATLRAIRGIVASAIQRYESAALQSKMLETLDFQTSMNLLKVNVSEMAISAVMDSLQTCGLAGYRNDCEFSVCRHVRDVLSTSIMINNDRILANVAEAASLLDVPALLHD